MKSLICRGGGVLKGTVIDNWLVMLPVIIEHWSMLSFNHPPFTTKESPQKSSNIVTMYMVGLPLPPYIVLPDVQI